MDWPRWSDNITKPEGSCIFSQQPACEPYRLRVESCTPGHTISLKSLLVLSFRLCHELCLPRDAFILRIYRTFSALYRPMPHLFSSPSSRHWNNTSATNSLYYEDASTPALAAVPLRSSIFCDVTRRRWVFGSRRFEMTYRSHHEGSRCRQTTIQVPVWVSQKIKFSSIKLLTTFGFRSLYHHLWHRLALSAYRRFGRS